MQGFEEEKVEGSRDHMVLVSLLNLFCPAWISPNLLPNHPCPLSNLQYEGKGFLHDVPMFSKLDDRVPFFTGFLHLRTGPHVTRL